MPVLTLDPADTTVYEPGVYQGVIGGIPTRTTVRNVLDYGAVEGLSGSVATNNAAFTAARAACGQNEKVYFPAGTWNVTSVGFSFSLSNRTICGAGMLDTVLRIHGSDGATFGVDPSFTSGFCVVATVVSGFTKGTSTFTTSAPTTPTNGNSANFTVGRIILIQIPNEATTPIVVTQGDPNMRKRYARVTSWNSGTRQLGFFPPLDHDIVEPAGMTIRETQFATHSRCGIEDLTIDGSGGNIMTSGVKVNMSDQIWVKRVKVVNFLNKGIWFTPALMPEVRECWMDGPIVQSPNRAGILCDGCTHALIEHNISEKTFPNIEVNVGSVGCIIAYNYFPQYTNTNHGAHNSLNLYEGNITSYFIEDGYFGGASRQIYYRNWSPGGNLASFKRFSRRPLVIGNIAGTPGVSAPEPQHIARWGDPNIGNINNNGKTVAPSLGSWWFDWDISIPGPRRWPGVVTTRTSNTNATITLDSGLGPSFLQHLLEQGGGLNYGRASLQNSAGATTGNFVGFSSVSGDVATVNANTGSVPDVGQLVTFYPSASGFAEKDLDVATSAVRLANYYVYYNSIGPDEALGSGVTLADSLYLVTKPAIFGSLTYPPFDPYSVGTPSTERIPAGFFYVNGVWPTDTPTAPVITVQPTTQTVTEGASVTLIANASGSPSPTWQWKKNGSDISGATSRSLAFASVAEADEGSYTAVATNSQGSATTNAAVLTVSPAGDTTPPNPNPSTIESITVNSTTQITVVATETNDVTSPPVEYNHSIDGTYQGWQVSRSRIFAGLTPSTAYSFRVKSRDSAGNETTQSAASSETTFAVSSAGNPAGNRGSRAIMFGAF